MRGTPTSTQLFCHSRLANLLLLELRLVESKKNFIPVVSQNALLLLKLNG
jgi:hypothetical protein